MDGEAIERSFARLDISARASSVDDHLDLEDAFLAVRDATSPGARGAAQKQLGVLLTGHSIAEESVLYPALALMTKRCIQLPDIQSKVR